jgi:hypothetical protein
MDLGALHEEHDRLSYDQKNDPFTGHKKRFTSIYRRHMRQRKHTESLSPVGSLDQVISLISPVSESGATVEVGPVRPARRITPKVMNTPPTKSDLNQRTHGCLSTKNCSREDKTGLFCKATLYTIGTTQTLGLNRLE